MITNMNGYALRCFATIKTFISEIYNVYIYIYIYIRKISHVISPYNIIYSPQRPEVLEFDPT
jgi:uncharacterized membrane protein YcgQ (UPF0703/DUF1980 family)